MSARLVVGALALAGLVSATGAPSGASSARASGAARAAARTVWLCRPGQADDPCTSDLSSTTVTAQGSAHEETALSATSSKFDCFYVYPTVSPQATPNANLEVQGEETVTAEDQASRFSADCRVWAPMYRQRTAGSLQKGLGADPAADPVSDVAREEAAYKA
jgi:hypothetical protein